MNDDELLQRLRASMPPLGPVHDPDSAHAAALKEQIMNTPLDTPPVSGTAPAPAPHAPRRRRFGWLAAAGVAAAAAVTVGIAALGGGGSEPATLTFPLGSSDLTTGMCLPVTEYQPPADLEGFAGTVTSVDAGKVTLDVDRWYRGGPSDQVVLDTGGLPSPALDGVEFVVGQRYLVTLIDGSVGLCGLSGPATPEFQPIFEGWFGA